jgi:predicted alpha-1,2-mannosidase
MAPTDLRPEVSMTPAQPRSTADAAPWRVRAPVRSASWADVAAPTRCAWPSPRRAEPPRRHAQVILAALLGTLAPAAAGCGAADDPLRPDAGGATVDASPDASASADAGVDSSADPLAAVDPFVGTGGLLGNLGSGSPAATAPLGLVKAGPDTTNGASQPAFSHCSGYNHNDKFLLGFSHNRLHGTGIPDYGNVLLLPTDAMTPAKATRYGRRVGLDHASERAEPGRYAVRLHAPEIDVEITATERCALHRYRFAASAGQGTVIVDAAAAQAAGRSRGGAVQLDRAAGLVAGEDWSHGAFSGRYGGYRVYFRVQFDRPLVGGGVWQGEGAGPGGALAGVLQPAADATATTADPAHFGAWATFDLGGARGASGAVPAPGEVRAKVCLSYVDAAGAAAAVAAELPDWDASAALARTQALWRALLGRVRVQGATATTRKRLYTALYHALQMPTLWTDVDGRFRGFDGAVHSATGWRYVTDLSLWDTFRTAHPLYALLFPEVQRDALRSLVAMRQQGGWVPRWPMGGGDGGSMIGAHAASVAADTVVKGLAAPGRCDFDVAALYEGLAETLSGPLPAGAYGGLEGIESFHAKGYVSRSAAGGSVSRTLEYAYGCFCMAQLAGHLGRAADVAKWTTCAGHYRNLWDAGTGFFRARHDDGNFTTPFDPNLWVFDGNPEYVEGSAWQWAWFAPHDDAGLRALHGGDAAFAARLDGFLSATSAEFNRVLPGPSYYHGNEPDIDAAWLLAGAGRPDLTQRWTRRVLTQMVEPTPDGIPGNDDGGTLAAWSVFATLGLYPRPGMPGYVLSLPLVDRAELDLPGGAVVVIEAPGAGALPEALARTAGAPTWRGGGVVGAWLAHGALPGGGVLRWVLE